MGKFLPIRVTLNDETEKIGRVENKNGRVWLRVGYRKDGIDICIAQSDDGMGVIIDAWDSKTCEKHLGGMAVWFDEINEEQEKENRDDL